MDGCVGEGRRERRREGEEREEADFMGPPPLHSRSTGNQRNSAAAADRRVFWQGLKPSF